MNPFRFLLLSLLFSNLWVCGCRSNSPVQILGPSKTVPNVLKGQYAFLLSGFDTTGKPLGIVGSITSDGMGLITGGSVEVNDNFTISSNISPLVGNYTLDSDMRGRVTITNTVGSVTQPLEFAFTLKADGSAGNLIEFDANHFIAAGTIQHQDSGALFLLPLRCLHSPSAAIKAEPVRLQCGMLRRR